MLGAAPTCVHADEGSGDPIRESPRPRGQHPADRDLEGLAKLDMPPRRPYLHRDLATVWVVRQEPSWSACTAKRSGAAREALALRVVDDRRVD